ncbi:MAG: hypothetical protein GC159_14295 [Phycisphaera sp.]|nr:hypothetical protein [Phycisphaera sp.]
MGDRDIIAAKQHHVIENNDKIPAMIEAGGDHARFAWEEFIYGTVSNEHTRRAYLHAVGRLLRWCHKLGLDLRRISPRHIREYLDQHSGCIATRKQHLAAIRLFFDVAVTRHVVVLNPALSVRGERLSVVEGKTPEIAVPQARLLIDSIDISTVTGRRDRAIIATLIYTAARIGAVAKLRRKDLYDIGEQWCLHFDDKGGKSRENATGCVSPSQQHLWVRN